MKRRTYKNFLLVMDILQDVKHYTKAESEILARQIFDNVEEDRGHGDRPAEWFLDKILPKEEWLSQISC